MNIRHIHMLSWMLALALAATVFAQLPVTAILPLVSGIPLFMWLVWISLNVVVILVYVWRWRCLAAAAGPVPVFTAMLAVRQAGQAVSFITPGPQFGGEPLQLYWLWKRYSVPGHAAMLGLVLDRFYELWTNFAVLLGGVLLLVTSPQLIRADWFNILMVLCGLIGLLSFSGWLMVFHPGKILAAVRGMAGRWRHHPRLLGIDTHWNLFSENLRSIVRGERPVLFTAFLLSMLGWFGMLIELWLLLSLVGAGTGFTGFVFVLVALRLALLLPLPGGVGSVEAALLWTFQLLDLPIASAAALIALIRLRDAIILAAGILAVYVVHVRPGGDISR